MNKRKISRWKKGKGIKKVTHMPDFILRIKGRFDAKKPSLPEAHTEKFLKSLAAIENAETLFAENILSATRDSAIKAIRVIKEPQNMSFDSPVVSGNHSEAEIRALRQESAKRSALVANVQSAKEALPSLNETIISTHTILDERIEKTRKKACKKLMAYVSGVRKGGKSDFDVSINEDDSAREIYRNHHKRLDDLIDRTVYSGLESDSDKETDA